MVVPVTLETTPGCAATLRVLWAAEELGVPVALTLRPEGHFRAHHGGAGPLWVEAGATAPALGFEAILERLRAADPGGRFQPEGTERWCRWYFTALLPAVRALGAGLGSGGAPDDALRALLPLLTELEAHLAAGVRPRPADGAAGAASEGGPWVADGFGLADCTLFALRELGRRWPPFAARFPAIGGWLSRAEARPAMARASARLREAFAPMAG